MSERLHNQPQYELRIVNGREVRVEVPAKPAEPATEIVAKVIPAFTPEVPVGSTIATVREDLNKKQALADIFASKYGEVPAKLSQEINELKSELMLLQFNNDNVAEKASILQEKSQVIAEFESEEQRIEREYQEQRAAIQAKKQQAIAEAQARLDAQTAQEAEIGKYLIPESQPVQERPRVTKLPVEQSLFDEGETMLFASPIVAAEAVVEPKVQLIESPEPLAQSKLESVVEDITEIAEDTPASEPTSEPFMQKPQVFVPRDFSLLEGQTLVAKTRSEQVKEAAATAAIGAAKLAAKAALSTAEAVRKTGEKDKRPSRRTVKLGAYGTIGALVLTGSVIGGVKLIGQHNEKAAIAEQQQAADAELAAQIFASCDEAADIEAFQKPWLTNTYDSVSGITFVAKNGTIDPTKTDHTISVNKERTNSIITISGGEVNTIMCDNDSDPAVTIDGTNVTVNADKLTAVSGVVDNNEGAKKQFKAPYLTESTTPSADGSLTQEDIDEIKNNSNIETEAGKKIVTNALAQSIEATTNMLNSNADLLQNTVKGEVVKQAQKQVTERLAGINEDTEYTVTVKGENPSYKAQDFVAPEETNKTYIRSEDVEVKITK